MENYSHLVSSFLYTRDLRMSAGVAGNLDLAAGLLLGYFLLGLAAVTLAFCSQRSRLRVFKNSVTLSFSCRRVQNVYRSLIFLLTIEALTAITAVILVIQFATSACDHPLACVHVFNVWMVLRWDVLVLHLQTALVAILYLCHPQWGARLRLVAWVVVLLLIVFAALCVHHNHIALLVLGVLMIGLALIIIIKSAVSVVSPPAAFWKKMITCVAVSTFVLICAPTFVAHCLVISSATSVEYLIVYVNVLFFTNFHLLMDGLLCFCILKLPNEEEEEQQQQQQESSVENPNYVPRM